MLEDIEDRLLKLEKDSRRDQERIHKLEKELEALKAKLRNSK